MTGSCRCLLLLRHNFGVRAYYPGEREEAAARPDGCCPALIGGGGARCWLVDR